MIKIAALNEELEEDSNSEQEATKEALEQIALQQYAKALDLQRKGNLPDAMQLLKDLLETELLYDVKKPAPGEKSTVPLFNLKYLCYKNVANMQSSAGEIGQAIESYSSAADLDDTDVSLWRRLGLLCIQDKQYERALYAFKRGVQCNPRHWPCLDKTLTLQLALGFYGDCISTIYDTLQLDPGYIRAIVYRKHIFTNFRYVTDFLTYLDPKYKWDPKEDEEVDEIKAEMFIKEAEDIGNIYFEQLNSDKVKYVLPELKLQNPISSLSWLSVGESLTHMHHYMTENSLSHASVIEINFEKLVKPEAMEVCEELNQADIIDTKSNENAMDLDKTIDVTSDDNNELSDKVVTDTEKVESDIEVPPTEIPIESCRQQVTEITKETKKSSVRRRGSALSFLEQWEWCTKRRSGRKKTTNKQDRSDESIYETLRRMVPNWLASDNGNKKDNDVRENSPDTMDLYKLFEEKDNEENMKQSENLYYFDTEAEQKDVRDYIDKFTANKCDMIDLLKEFLKILAEKWTLHWPKGLWRVCVDAHKCYSEHIDIPSFCDDNKEEIMHYIYINLLCQEFIVNDKLNSNTDEKLSHELNVVESIGLFITTKPNLFLEDCLELMLRYLWLKLHIHLINKADELALDCLYQLLHEFRAMGEHHNTYCLHLKHFTFKPSIKENEVVEYIKFLERNKQLSTVMELYDMGNYDEVLTIVIDSFEHCKNLARQQEEEMSLDFAVQLSIILDCYWALGKVDECFKWSIICLHEALKHYFLCSSGSADFNKWSLTTVKVLACIEHVLTTEGLSCLETLSQKELSACLEDLIRIIGHQVDTNALEMPFGTVIPWIIIHYILQREDDQGRSRRFNDKDIEATDEIPNPLLVLFIAHEQLGSHGWCCKNDGKLLFFILDTVVPLLRSPSLSRPLEQVCQYMEQCIFCLFGHPGKKTKLKYLTDHNVSPYPLDWNRAQQLYEVFKPPTLPEVEGKIPSFSADTEQLFHRILALLPTESEPQKYVPEMEKFINGKLSKLPVIPPLLPYKMKDIYFLLGDYYFKKEERKMSVKYNMFDIIVNSDRCESWAEIALAKAVNLELKLNSCINIDNEKDYLNPARATIRCFRRALELDSLHCNLWIEYGVFVYSVYSFCSRLLKQASESLSMNDFESLEEQKEDMLNTTQKCFTTVIQDRLNNSNDKDKVNDEMWLHYYMMGKVAEKRNKHPSVYLSYYMKAIQSLQEADAVYPSKISYNSPQHLSIEVLEVHYRMHASILKHIEQHENKPIPMSVGKVFLNCIEEWKNGPFMKKPKKDGINEMDVDSKSAEATPQAANILKRSISDAGEEDNQEAKKLKFEAAAAKVRRSASYDTERIVTKDSAVTTTDPINETREETNTDLKKPDESLQSVTENGNKDITGKVNLESNATMVTETNTSGQKDDEIGINKKEETSSGTSSTTSSETSSDDSTSSSSSDSSRDSTESAKVAADNKPITEDEIMNIIYACLDALEDCSSRFPPHYKAIYRLAHYHFYYKKGKAIERCRDLMLSTFTSRSNQKLNGLFCERKQSNFFNGIWRIPLGEVDRAGGFSCHMNRCVLLTMEILKEIDDHKTLLDLSLHLQRVPEPDKKYLRDADREDLAQQAFSLCVQSLKGQLIKFSQQADLKSNDVERQALNSLMLDIYRAYLRAQKQPNSKQLTNLLVDGYKLVSMTPVNETTNLVDLSMKHCQLLIAALKQKATLASIDRSNQNAQRKQAAKIIETVKSFNKPLQVNQPVETSAGTPNVMQPKVHQDHNKVPTPTLPTMSAQDMASAFQNYLPMINDTLLSQQTAAALSLTYLSNLSALANYSYQNSFQSEFYRQFMGPNFPSFNPQLQKKQQKRAKPTVPRSQMPTTSTSNQVKGPSKSFSMGSSQHSVSKTTQSLVTNVTKSISTPSTLSLGSAVTSSVASFGVPAQPAHMSTASQSAHVASTKPLQAHVTNSSTVNAAIHTKPPLPHEQVSPGKTLQEKLAERQKNHPTMKTSHDALTSLSRLPSSLTVTKSVNKPPPPVIQKKPEPKKNTEIVRPKPSFSSNDIIVLDDDDD